MGGRVIIFIYLMPKVLKPPYTPWLREAQGSEFTSPALSYESLRMRGKPLEKPEYRRCVWYVKTSAKCLAHISCATPSIPYVCMLGLRLQQSKRQSVFQ